MKIILKVILLLLSVSFVKLEKNIKSPPVITSRNPDEVYFRVPRNPFVAPADVRIVLKCEATISASEVKYRWTRNGEAIDLKQSKTELIAWESNRNGNLVFSKPIDSDEGEYRCFASNGNGVAVSKPIRLKKAFLETLPAIPEIITAIEGAASIQLPCNIPNSQPSALNHWTTYSASRRVATPIQTDPRFKTDSDGHLWILNVRLEDDSLHANLSYFCTNFNRITYDIKVSTKIWLRVLPAPQTSTKTSALILKSSPKNIDANIGSHVRLDCLLGGNPLPDIQWRKHGNIIRGATSNILELASVGVHDSGVYQCSTWDDALHHSIYLTVLAKPQFGPNHQTEVMAAEGDPQVAIICQPDGHPKPTIEWFFNANTITAGFMSERWTVSGNNITILDVTDADAGVFGCAATNKHGSDYAEVSLSVAG